MSAAVTSLKCLLLSVDIDDMKYIETVSRAPSPLLVMFYVCTLSTKPPIPHATRHRDNVTKESQKCYNKSLQEIRGEALLHLYLPNKCRLPF